MARQPFLKCKSRSQAMELFPKAVAVIEVEGGFLCFHSIDDYLEWNKTRTKQ